MVEVASLSLFPWMSMAWATSTEVTGLGLALQKLLDWACYIKGHWLGPGLTEEGGSGLFPQTLQRLLPCTYSCGCSLLTVLYANILCVNILWLPPIHFQMVTFCLPLLWDVCCIFCFSFFKVFLCICDFFLVYLIHVIYLLLWYHFTTWIFISLNILYIYFWSISDLFLSKTWD